MVEGSHRPKQTSLGKIQIGRQVGEFHVYSMADLNQQTPGVINEIIGRMEPGLLARYREYIAIIEPLDRERSGRIRARQLRDLYKRHYGEPPDWIVSGQKPSIGKRVGEFVTYTMQDLGQRSGGVMDELVELGHPVFLLREGWPIAIIDPRETPQLAEQRQEIKLASLKKVFGPSPAARRTT
jgi:hypothetical protein